MGPTGVCHCTKYRAGAGSYALWAKMHLCSEQNDALQRTENYAESIAALLKDKHPGYVAVGRDETW